MRSQSLASKSNYQCIIEGEHASLGPYPDDLIQQVVSKRVSHSEAERARRERLNNALQKLAEILAGDPKEGPLADVQDIQDPIPSREGAETFSSAITEPNTKAEIVERAIVYIKSQKRIAREMEATIEDCQRRIARSGGS